MNIVYLGTPDFAVKPLEAILNSGLYKVVAAVTNPDKPVGRKKILTPPPVKVFAQEKGLRVLQYDKIRLQGVEELSALKPDLMITCAFGQILSKEILDIPKYGVINIHASLLPKYRGASPIHFALLNGENQTGITIMKTDEGIDTGDMLLQKAIDIGENETCGELFERLSILGAECILEALPLISNGQASFVKQDDKKATFSKLIKKELALIDWTKSAFEVKNQIRAFNPAPVAYSYLFGEAFKIYSAEVCVGSGTPGCVIDAEKELIVACGEGALSLKKVQKAGGKPLAINDFLRGNKIPTGTCFTNNI